MAKIYRPRAKDKFEKREGWVTTCWYWDRKDAETMLKNADNIIIDGRIVEDDYEEFIAREQRIPKVN